MKKQVTLIILTALFVLLQAQTGNIKGRIIDALTKQALPEANITMVGLKNKGASTDNEGNFVITNVMEDVHKLKIQYVGYQSILKTNVRVVRGKTTDLHEIELTETAVIGEAVVFTAGYFNDSKEAPVSRHEFTKEEINRAPGAAGDVFRAIESLPGASSTGGEFSSFFVRGGAPDDNLILVDNIPFSNTAHYQGAGDEEEAKQGGRFSIFTSGLMEEADFQAGGFSARYGGKSASVLNLKLKEGNKESFKIDGTYDLFGWELNYDGPVYFNQNSSLVFSARQQNLENIFKMVGEETQGVPAFDDYVAKYVYEPTSQDKISVLGVYSTETMNRDIKHIYAGEEDEDLFSNELIDHEEDKLIGGINWRHIGKNNLLFNSTIYGSRISREDNFGRAFTNPVDGVFPLENEVGSDENLYHLKNNEAQTGFKASVVKALKDHVFTLGGGVERKKLDNSLTLSRQDTTYTFDANDNKISSSDLFLVLNPEHVNSRYQKSHDFINLLSELSYDLTNKLTLTAGLRYDYNTISDKNYFSPRFSARYQLNDRTNFNFATGLYYQNPDMSLVASSENKSKIENEESLHLITGVTHYIKEDLKFTVEGYYKSLDNLIVTPDRASYDVNNDGEGWAAGFDLSLVKRMTDKFYGQLGYSYSVSKRDDNDGYGEYDSDFSQPHIFNILAGYQFNQNWSVSAKWKYATGRPTSSYIVHENVHNNEDFYRYSREYVGHNDERLPDFHTLNVRVDYRKQFMKNLALVAFIDILNAYDRLNVNNYEFIPATGEITEKGLKMMPSFGLRFEL